MRKRGAQFKRRIDTTAGLHCITMQHQLADDQLRDLGIAVHAAVESLRTGQGREQDFHTLAAAVNVSLILCERAVGSEYLGIVKTAQDALLRVWQRGKTTGRWAFDGPGYTAITDAVTLHEQQISNVSRRACREAMMECTRRVMRGEVLNVCNA